MRLTKSSEKGKEVKYETDCVISEENIVDKEGKNESKEKNLYRGHSGQAASATSASVIP